MGEPRDRSSPRRSHSRSRRSWSRSPPGRRSCDRSRGRRPPSGCLSEKPRRQDSFGRTVVGRSRASSSSGGSQRERRRNKRCADSRSRSGSPRAAFGGVAPNGFPPPMFPGMPFMPGMGMPGYPYPPMWGWPGMPPPPAQERDHRSRSRERRRYRGHGRSRSRSRSRSRRLSQDDYDDSVLISRKLTGRVIGRGGSIIKRIREDSGARIDAVDRDEDHCELKISGAEEQVRHAKGLILEQVDKASSAARNNDVPTGEEEASETLDFPAGLFGGIVGARGVKINEVRQNSGAKINVDKTDDRCTVKVFGSHEQVDRAKVMLKSLADEASAAESASKRPTKDDDCDERMEFPLSAAGRIIGARGAQVAEIRSRSGAEVRVEKLEDCCRVYLSGSPEQVERARELVKGCVSAEETMEIPKNMVGRVLGRGGETITRLERDSGAKIDLDGHLDPCPVHLVGPREAIERARRMICEVMGAQPWAAPGYPANPWGMWAHGAAYPLTAPAWELPSSDGRGYAPVAKEEAIDLDEL